MIILHWDGTTAVTSGQRVYCRQCSGQTLCKDQEGYELIIYLWSVKRNNNIFNNNIKKQ